MALEWLIMSRPQTVSRGERIASILDGSGSVEVLPGRPDVECTPSDFARYESTDPDIDFDINSYSRVDKFDGLEVGQSLIDERLDSRKPDKSSSEEK